MNLFTINTPFNIALEFSLTALYRRMVAWFVDLIVLFSYGYFMSFFVYQQLLGSGIGDLGDRAKLGFILGLFIIIIPSMFYHLLFEVFMNGRTPGKWLMSARVMNRDGASATFSQLLLRWILCIPNYVVMTFTSLLFLPSYLRNNVAVVISPAYILVVLMLIGLAAVPDIIAIVASAKSQRLGDLAAGTVVIDTRYRADITETIFLEVVETSYQVSYPQVLKLSDRDMNSVRNLLDSKMNKDTERYLYRVAYRIEEVLAVKMNGTPQQFLKQLLLDYNYLTQDNIK